MDRMIYTAMTGAQHILDQQATNAQNMANASSTGFKAQLDTFRAVPVVGAAMDTRAFVVNASSGTDFTPGPIVPTGRNLDIAIEGKGWFSVQRADGSVLPCQPIPDFLMDMVHAGGLMNVLKQRSQGTHHA